MPKRKPLEVLVEEILKQLYVSYQRNVRINEFQVDFLLSFNKVIECHGDYWHCNPIKYSPTYRHRARKVTADAIWKRDAQRIQQLQNTGYSVLILWESEIRLQPQETQRKIKRFLKGIPNVSKHIH